MYATTKGGGMTMAFPNVCKVPAPPAPPVPVPFPSMGQCASATGGTCTKKTKAMGKPMLHVGSEIPVSQGDEGGVSGGLQSGTRGQVVKRLKGSKKVELEGNPAVTNAHPISSNKGNAPMGNQLTPSQTKILILG